MPVVFRIFLCQSIHIVVAVSLGKHVLPLQLPLGKEDNFQGIIDLYKMKAYRANGNGSDEIEIPDEYKEAAEEAREKMIEAAVEADDDCMMRFQQQMEYDCWLQGNRKQTAPAQRMADFVNGRLSADLPRSSFSASSCSVPSCR